MNTMTNNRLIGAWHLVRLETTYDDGGLTLSASDKVPASEVMRHHRLVWKRRP